jgi:hypothetical protein
VILDEWPDRLIEDGDPVTVGEAGETYLRTDRWNRNSDQYTSKHQRHLRELYPRILEADRHFQQEYSGLTTAMLTRRLSPLDNNCEWLTPWECNEMLHGGRIQRSIRDAIDYHIDAEYEWLGVTAPTRSAGTPHEHIYLWIEDPDDTVTVGDLKPARDLHLKHCTNAYKHHHRCRGDTGGQAITVQHSPDQVDEIPDHFLSVLEHSPTFDKNGDIPKNTTGAQYLASQLVYLHLADFYDAARNDPPQALFEGAALAWVSDHNWFRHGQGLPSL